jgi:hypothetical protein
VPLFPNQLHTDLHKWQVAEFFNSASPQLLHIPALPHGRKKLSGGLSKQIRQSGLELSTKATVDTTLFFGIMAFVNSLDV